MTTFQLEVPTKMTVKQFGDALLRTTPHTQMARYVAWDMAAGMDEREYLEDSAQEAK